MPNVDSNNSGTDENHSISVNSLTAADKVSSLDMSSSCKDHCASNCTRLDLAVEKHLLPNPLLSVSVKAVTEVIKVNHGGSQKEVEKCDSESSSIDNTVQALASCFSTLGTIEYSSASTQTTEDSDVMSLVSLSSSKSAASTVRFSTPASKSQDTFRVLLIFANPTNTHQLRLQTEEKAIREAVQRGEFRKNIEIDVLLACTIDDLSRKLMTTPAYEVIHFSGHADRSASLLRHTMKSLHALHDADVSSLKTPAVVRQVEEAVEALLRRFESSLLSSPSSSSFSSTGRQQYSPVPTSTSASASASTRAESTTANFNINNSFVSPSSSPCSPSRSAKHQQPEQECGDTHTTSDQPVFSVETQFHHNRIEKDVVITPMSVASHLLVREVDVGLRSGVGGSQRAVVPYGSSPLQRAASEGGEQKSQEFTLFIPNLMLKSRSSPSKVVEVNYERSYTYQELMDIGVGSLAFESETHDTSSNGTSFVSPSSFASVLAHHCADTLQCVVLNVCGGHIQGDVLSSIVPFTVFFTGKITDKESLAFSRGFYDSIGMGQSVLQAFREGSSRMDLHKLAPGIPDRFSSVPPLITLLKNNKLIEESLLVVNTGLGQKHRAESDSISASSRDEEDIKEQNRKILEENKELRAMIAYGMQLLRSKDEELLAARRAVDFLSGGVSNNKHNTSKKVGAIENGEKRKTNFSSAEPSSSHKKKYIHVKSSGYGRSNTSLRSKSEDRAAKPNHSKLNKNQQQSLKKATSKRATDNESRRRGVFSPMDQAPSGQKKDLAMMKKTSNKSSQDHVKSKVEEAKRSVSKTLQNDKIEKLPSKLPVDRNKQQQQQQQQQEGVSLATINQVQNFNTSLGGLVPECLPTSDFMPPSTSLRDLPAAVEKRNQDIEELEPKISRRNRTSSGTCVRGGDFNVSKKDRKESVLSSTSPSRSSRVSSSLQKSSSLTKDSSLSSPPRGPPRIPSHSSSPFRSEDVVFTTTIAVAKPNAWAKFYISENVNRIDELVDSDSGVSIFNTNDLSRNSSPPPPMVSRKVGASIQLQHHKGRQGSVGSSNSGNGVKSSSLGLRKFLEERRSESQRQKPSPSFASVVSRFENSPLKNSSKQNSVENA